MQRRYRGSPWGGYLHFGNWVVNVRLTSGVHTYIIPTLPLSSTLDRFSAQPWCRGASRHNHVVVLWTLCSLFAFLQYDVNIPSIQSPEEPSWPNISDGSETASGLMRCNLCACTWAPVLPWVTNDHRARVSTNDVIHEVFPLPGPPATIIPREGNKTAHQCLMVRSVLPWGKEAVRCETFWDLSQYFS